MRTKDLKIRVTGQDTCLFVQNFPYNTRGFANLSIGSAPRSIVIRNMFFVFWEITDVIMPQGEIVDLLISRETVL